MMAVENVRAQINSEDCRVIQGMETEGIMTVVPSWSFLFNISLEVKKITVMEKKRVDRLEKPEALFQYEQPTVNNPKSTA